MTRNREIFFLTAVVICLGMAQIVRVVERLNPKVIPAVRTRYEGEMPKLYELGADIVVMEEWEASYELNKVILEHFDIPEDRIAHHLDGFG